MDTFVLSWGGLAILGTVFQLGRNACQKSLKDYVNDWMVTATRFFFGVPLVAMVYIWGIGAPAFPQNRMFYLYCLIGALAQIGGTRCLMGCFTHRQFAVGITFMKLESVVTAIFGAMIFADHLTGLGMVMVGLGCLGVVIVAIGHQKISWNNIRSSMGSPAVLYGVSSGVCFAVASVLFRQANILVNDFQPIDRGVITLLVVLLIQTIVMVAVMGMNPNDQWRKLMLRLPHAIIIGCLGAAASICWFIAFGLANAAYVKTVGQMDAVLSLLVGWVWFKERLKFMECLGIGLVVGSVIATLIMV